MLFSLAVSAEHTLVFDFQIWCPEEDSNLHAFRHTDLNRARLPIPPSGQQRSHSGHIVTLSNHVFATRAKLD